MLGPLNSVWTNCGRFARSCFARTQKSSRFAQWPKTLYSTAYRNCSLVKVLLLKKGPAISITTLGETTCCCLNTRDLRIATQQMRMFATSLVWTPSHMRASIRALYSFYLHLERGRWRRWERNCQRNSAADEKLFITSHGGEGVYNFRRGLDLGVNFENSTKCEAGRNFKTRDWHSM